MPDRGKLVVPQCRHGTTNHELRRNKWFCQMNECIVQVVKAMPTASEEHAHSNRHQWRTHFWWIHTVREALPRHAMFSVSPRSCCATSKLTECPQTAPSFHAGIRFSLSLLVLFLVSISAPFAPTCWKKVPLLRASSRVSRHMVLRATTHVTARSAKA